MTQRRRPTLAPLLASLLLLATPLAARAAESTPPLRVDAQERWTINLRDTGIQDFIATVSGMTGRTIVVDPAVKGQVTVMSQSPMGLDEIDALFAAVMASHGYAVLHEGARWRVLPDNQARSEAGQPGSGPDAIETRVLKVQHSSAAELLPLIRPLVADYGHLAAVPSANALIISDRRANVARIEGILRQLDGADQRRYTTVVLANGWARDIAAALNDAIARGKHAGTAQAIADERTNRLLLLGPVEARQWLDDLARSLDQPAARAANTRVIRLRYADAKKLAQTLSAIGQSLQSERDGAKAKRDDALLIRADESLNALVLHAEPAMIDQLQQLAQQLDVPRSQVLVEAAIVEISGDIDDVLGVQWAVNNRHGGVGGSNFNNAGLSIGTVLGALQGGDAAAGQAAAALPSGAILGIGSDNFGALITALSANSKSNLLSTPSLLTLDNQSAQILVGQNVPFQTGSYTTTANGAGNPFTTIERHDIGITLKVTPHITDGEHLRLEVDQEISSLTPTPSNVKLSDVVTNKRSIKSTVLARDGQVVVLGGLIQDDNGENLQRVPGLSRIPVVGALFRSKARTHTKRNLMVFLRATVVHNGSRLDDLSDDRYQRLRRQQERGDAPLPAAAGQLFAPPAAATAPRLSIRLMTDAQAQPLLDILQRHPGRGLRLTAQTAREGGGYALLYGDYADRSQARAALRALETSELPRRGALIVEQAAAPAASSGH